MRCLPAWTETVELGKAVGDIQAGLIAQLQGLALRIQALETAEEDAPKPPFPYRNTALHMPQEFDA